MNMVGHQDEGYYHHPGTPCTQRQVIPCNFKVFIIFQKRNLLQPVCADMIKVTVVEVFQIDFIHVVSILSAVKSTS